MNGNGNRRGQCRQGRRQENQDTAPGQCPADRRADEAAAPADVPAADGTFVPAGQGSGQGRGQGSRQGRGPRGCGIGDGRCGGRGRR